MLASSFRPGHQEPAAMMLSPPGFTSLKRVSDAKRLALEGLRFTCPIGDREEEEKVSNNQGEEL